MIFKVYTTLDSMEPVEVEADEFRIVAGVLCFYSAKPTAFYAPVDHPEKRLPIRTPPRCVRAFRQWAEVQEV